jgi:branched-chain amino acid transport system permease protein
LFLAVLGNTFFYFVAALLQFNIAIYAVDVLKISETQASPLQAALAIGIGLGSFAAGYLSGHKIEYGFIPLGSIGITLLVLVALFLFFRFTPLGLAMRAVAQNPLSSRLVGIRVGWMLALGWGLAAAVGAVAGMLVAPIVYLEPNMMSGVLLYAFAAALVGGIDNPFGAVVGGFMVGVLENLIGAYVIGTELKLTVALVLIVGVLLFKPSGMFGKVFVSRV